MTAVSSIFMTPDIPIPSFSSFFTFAFSATRFGLPYSFTSFSSFDPPEILCYPLSNFPSSKRMEIFDHDDIQSVHRSLFKNVGKDVSMPPLNLSQYHYKEVFLLNDQLRILNFRYTCSARVIAKELLEVIMPKQISYYRFRTTFVFVLHDGNLGDPNARRLVDSTDGSGVIKDSFNIVVLDGWNDVVEIVPKPTEHLWTACHLSMDLLMRRGGANI